MPKIKVLLVDDNSKFLQLAKNILSSDKDIAVIGEAMDGKEAISKVKELKPDIVLMDVRMPGMNGLTATSSIKQIMPEVKVLIVTIYDSDEYKEAAMSSGASGFIVKKSIQDELIPKIKEGFELQ